MRKPVAILSVIFGMTLAVNSGFGQNQGTSNSTSAPAPASASNAARSEDYDPLLDLPPLKHNTVTLMGGVVVSLDEVMNHMVFEPFGTHRKMQVHFDTRTHFYLTASPSPSARLSKGNDFTWIPN